MRFVFMSSVVDLNNSIHNSLSLNGSWSPKTSLQVHLWGRCEHFPFTCFHNSSIDTHYVDDRFSLIRQRHDRFMFISTKLAKLSIFWYFTSKQIFALTEKLAKRDNKQGKWWNDERKSCNISTSSDGAMGGIFMTSSIALKNSARKIHYSNFDLLVRQLVKN